MGNYLCRRESQQEYLEMVVFREHLPESDELSSAIVTAFIKDQSLTHAAEDRKKNSTAEPEWIRTMADKQNPQSYSKPERIEATTLTNARQQELLKVRSVSRRSTIISGVTFSYQNVLIVWCPSGCERPDFVASILGAHDPEVWICDKWIQRNATSPTRTWGGALATFRFPEQLLSAFKELRNKARCVRAIPFSLFLDVLAQAEAHHRKFGVGSTIVVIRGQRSLTAAEEIEFEMQLYKLGNVIDSRFYRGRNEYGVICEVEYEFATHAHVATVVLTDRTIDKLGLITATVVGHEMSKCILRKANSCINTSWEELMPTCKQCKGVLSPDVCCT